VDEISFAIKGRFHGKLRIQFRRRARAPRCTQAVGGTARRANVGLNVCRLGKFSHDTSIVATCRQLSSAKVDAQCDKLATVVDRKLILLAKCRRSTGLISPNFLDQYAELGIGPLRL